MLWVLQPSRRAVVEAAVSGMEKGQRLSMVVQTHGACDEKYLRDAAARVSVRITQVSDQRAPVRGDGGGEEDAQPHQGAVLPDVFRDTLVRERREGEVENPGMATMTS